MLIAVGSQNPVKIQAASTAFKKLWPNKQWQVQGLKTQSGVNDQPMSDQESIKGAINRAQKAQKALNADYGIGLEGGLQQIGKYWFDCGWAAILNKQGEIGLGSTSRIQIPRSMLDLIKQGKELGEVDDILFQQENTKQSQGHFGLMTNGAITRTQAYSHGVIVALSRFLHPKIFAKFN